MIVDEVVVRNYNGTHEVSCGYSRPVGNYINPIDNPVDRDVFIIRDLSTGAITNIDTLPAGYHVRDIKFISLYKYAEHRYVDFCVFCGDRITITGGYWAPAPPGEPSQWINITEESGFVGFFYMEAALNPTSSDTIYLRDIEKTKSLSRMAVYNEYGGAYSLLCGNVYDSHPVLDIIGVPISELGYTSCVTRVKFYPECYNSIHWDNNINCPLNQHETIVDIAETDNFIVTLSTITNSDNLIWLRYNPKETSFILNGLSLVDYAFEFDLHTLTCSGIIPENPELTYYTGIPRITGMRGDTCVMSFFAVNEESGLDYYNGVFNFKIPLPYRFSIVGNYDKHSCSIVDVSSFPEEMASVTLTNESYNSDYDIHIADWLMNQYKLFPVYILHTGTDYRFSIDTYRNPSNIGWMHIGGSFYENFNRKWLLADNVYFSKILNDDCFVQEINYLPLADIGYYLLTDVGFYREPFYDFPELFPVTRVPMRNLIENFLNKCIRQDPIE